MRGGVITKGIVIGCVAAALMFLTVAPARAEIGSIISSFSIPDDAGNGIYREGNYVYVLQYEEGPTYNWLMQYTPSGDYVRRWRASPMRHPLSSGTTAHLGAGYLAVCNDAWSHVTILRTTGTKVTEFGTGVGAHNCFWTGEHYYVNTKSYRNKFLRFTSEGWSAGTWTCSGWSPAPYCGGAEYAPRGNNGEGPYFIISSGDRTKPLAMTTFPGGSLIKTWIERSGAVTHLAYGPSSKPRVYGSAIWAILDNPTQVKVIEIDIDARASTMSVTPTSFGKVKAIYR